MFAFTFSRSRLRLLSWSLAAVSLVACLFLWFFWAIAKPWLEAIEPALKLIGYLVGPLFAVIGFVTSRLDKIELQEKADALGQERERATKAQAEAKAAREDAASKGAEAKKLLDELKGITVGSEQLWKLRPARPFPNYKHWFDARQGAVVLTIGNLKGGVGKTTIAGNFAAYVSETLHKRVLLVDLDYQGSLSNLMLQALGREEIGSNVNLLFESKASLEDVLKARVHLVPTTEDVTTRLSRGWIITAGYDYSTLENQLLLSWLLNQDTEIDVRYRLANALLRPEVRREYDVIILDMPPRLTMGAVNALVASHYFFVPTVLDKLSVEAVPQFLANVKGIKRDLDLGIELGGIVGTLTKQVDLVGVESRHWQSACEGGWAWEKGTDYRIERTIPRRAAIADSAGVEVAYLHSNNQNRAQIRQILDPLFQDMALRIGLTAKS